VRPDLASAEVAWGAEAGAELEMLARACGEVGEWWGKWRGVVAARDVDWFFVWFGLVPAGRLPTLESTLWLVRTMPATLDCECSQVAVSIGNC
jgi:hypothetical protein